MESDQSKELRSLRNRRAYLKSREARKAKQKAYYSANRDKAIAYARNYHADRRVEHAAYCREYYRNHKESSLERGKAWRDGNPEKRAAYLNINADKIRKQKSEWYAKNRERELARMGRWAIASKRHRADYVKMRKELMRRAVPIWADRGMISAIYEHAAQMTSRTGISHHVDHIVPLRGAAVCGLHVENNLRVVPAVENMKKKNRFIEALVYDNPD